MTGAINNLLIGGLHFQADGFRIVYGLIAVWMWGLTALFSPEYFQHERRHMKRYITFTALTFAATEGVMFSADLMTTFFFFEILSLTSFVWVIHEQTPEAIEAAKTYFFIAIIGGLTLFMGLALLSYNTGTLYYSELQEAIAACGQPRAVLAAGICILLGFGAKAGMFPLHIWLPRSHPVAPSPASALLSGILTKVGIFGILMTAVPGFFGNGTFGLLILLAGTITMALGAVLALFSVNLKRTLACSSMSQIGFILVGIGTTVLISTLTEGTAGLSEETVHLAAEAEEFAHSGLILHMVNHSLIKLTLFMAAGVFVMNLGKLNLNEIRGYGRKKPLLLIPFALGALGISGVPFFNGYISKTLLHEGIVAAREAFTAGTLASTLHVIEWIFLVSGGLTFAYMLKLFICIFVEKPQQAFPDKPCMNRCTSTVLLISSLVLPVLGQPAVCRRLAALMTGEDALASFHAFSWTNLSGSLISLGIGAAVYLMLVRHVFIRQKHYVDLWPARLDIEYLIYRPLLLKILPGIGGAIAAVFGENKVLKPLCSLILRAVHGIADLLAVSTDGLIIFFRHTFLREFKRLKPSKIPQELHEFSRKTGTIMENLTESFSFSMLMICLGILLVLGAILASGLLHTM